MGSVLLLCLCALCFAVNFHWRNRPTPNHSFASVQSRIVVILCFALSARWIQVPYLNSLYQSYGYEMRQIVDLHIVEYISAITFGTMMASIADKYGRKASCTFFTLNYILSCITKFAPIHHLTMFGHFLAGISMSFLHTTFESWIIQEHRRLAFHEELIADTIYLTSLLHGFVPIAASFVADSFSERYGYIGTFYASIGCLVVCFILIQILWAEHHINIHPTVASVFHNSIKELTFNPRAQSIGIIQGLFEGSMAAFFFLWNPVVELASGSSGHQDAPPFRLLFIAFSISLATGCGIYQSLSKQYSVDRIMVFISVAAGFCLFVPALAPQSYSAVVMAFIIYQILCGMYLPCIAMLRVHYIRDDCRTALTNLLRIPLSIYALLIVIEAGFVAHSKIFGICAVGLFAAAAFHRWGATNASYQVISMQTK